MARYIDAEVLAERLLNAWNTADENKRADIMQIMANIVTPILVSTPTSDVVEVVRCKDCKHAYINSFSKQSGIAWCTFFANRIVQQDEFCSYGERKET